jgi:hypothetical protein
MSLSIYSGKSRKRRIKGAKKGSESSESNVSVKNKKTEVGISRFDEHSVA